MAKIKFPQKKQESAPNHSTNLDRLKAQLQKLVEQKSYKQAIGKAQLFRKIYPDVELHPSEAEIWVLRGQQEYHQAQYRSAQSFFQQAVDLGLVGDSHYWLSKTLLALEDPLGALQVIQAAFNQEILPKDYAGCYLKLLFLTGDLEKVSAVIAQQSKRFLAHQLHWARGVLALQDQRPQEAIRHFKKMTQNATPGDVSAVWLAYAHQQLGQWSEAQPYLEAAPSTHRAVQRLSVVQAIAQKQAVPIVGQLTDKNLMLVVHLLHLLHLLHKYDCHNAAHVMLKLSYPCPEFPEIDALFRPVLCLAVDQALGEGKRGCVRKFLESIVYQPPFDMQLALRLYEIYNGYDENMSAVQRLCNHMLSNIKKEAQTQPQLWPENRLNVVLAEVQCFLTDAWMIRGYHSQGRSSQQAAERFCAKSPEVIGRKGLIALTQEEEKQAITLMTQALEAGCRYDEVYDQLLRLLKRRGDVQAAKEIQLRFGKRFDDIVLDNEIKIPNWIEALSVEKYWMFEDFVDSVAKPDPPVQACQILIDQVEGEPSKSGVVAFKHARATEQWDLLLSNLSPQEQIPVLQAIFLSMEKFAKRQKGLAALQSRYLQQLFALTGDYPEAKLAHLVLRIVQGNRVSELLKLVSTYVSTFPQPGTALARLQLQVRWFAQTDILQPLLDKALLREPQNPQLLLAKGSTLPAHSPEGQDLKEQGFELARRLQDAPALQAYREEEKFQDKMKMNHLMPGFADFMFGDQDVLEVARRMARGILGDDVSPDLLETKLPQLVEILMAGKLGLNEDEDWIDDDFFDFPQLFPPPAAQKKGSSRRK